MSKARPPIHAPAKYVVPTAIGFADSRDELVLVSSEAPLPVSISNAMMERPVPLQGDASGSTVIGPFVPLSGVPIHLQLAGDWSGTVTLERSTDGGASRHPLTVGGMPWARFSDNVNEPVWQENEAAASFWLNVDLQQGVLTYRVAQ